MSIKVCFFFCDIAGGITHLLPEFFDPFVTVELPDETSVGKPTKGIEVLPDECVEKFKKVALSRNPDGTLAYRYGPALVFALNTGLRRGN